MDKPTKNNKALIYCAVWPDEGGGRSLEEQSIELQTYCVLRGLETVDIVTDFGPSPAKGRLRSGMERILSRAVDEGIGHIVVQDVGRIGRGSREVLSFLRDTFDPARTEVHVTSWKLTTASAEFARMIGMSGEILALDQTEALRDQANRAEKIRLKPLWTRLFGMLQDERYAEYLIRALFQLKDTVRLSDREYTAVHGGYDHLNMFRALGFRIKGEKTDNTKLVTDVLVRYWDKLRPHLSADLHRIIEGSETASHP